VPAALNLELHARMRNSVRRHATKPLGFAFKLRAVKRELQTHCLGAGAGNVGADVAGDVHELAARHSEVRQGARLHSHQASICCCSLPLSLSHFHWHGCCWVIPVGPHDRMCFLHLNFPFLHTTTPPQNAPSAGSQVRTLFRTVQRIGIPLPASLPLDNTQQHRHHILACTPSIFSSYSPHLGCQAPPAWPR
jgi:hypothetical protein